MYWKFMLIACVMLGVSTLDNPSLAAGDGNFALNRVNTLIGHKDNIESVSFSPDGDLLATGGDDNLIILWDSKTWKEVKRLKGHNDKVRALAFSPDGKILASGDNGNKVILWDTGTGKEIQRIKTGDDVNAVVFRPDGKLLAIANDSKNILLWDMSSTTSFHKLIGHNDDIKSVAFSRDGKLLASSSEDESIIVWDVTTEKILNQFKSHSGEVNTIAFTPDGKYLASGGNDTKIILWDLSTGAIKNIFTDKLSRTRALAFINNGEVLVSGGVDTNSLCKIRFWDTESGKKLTSQRSDCSLTNFSFSPDEKLIAIASNKITVMKRELALSDPDDDTSFNETGSYQKIIELPSQSKQKLFEKSKQWIAKTFVSSKQVIEYENLVDGKIIGNGSVNFIGFYVSSLAGGNRGIECHARFTITEDIKDDKIRVTFDQMRGQTCDWKTGDYSGVGETGLKNLKQKLVLLTQDLAENLSKSANDNW